MKKLQIAFATSEIVPYSKTGGLADVSGRLPFVLAELGHTVTVFTPLYQTIDRSKYKLSRLDVAGTLSVTVGDDIYDFELFVASGTGSAATVYFISQPQLFDRAGLYQNPKTVKDYPDNDKRFIFLAKAILRSLQVLDFKPDIIHANDWQTALLPVYLKTSERSNSFFANTGTLLTIHNLAYQGLFNLKRSRLLGLDKSYFYSMSPFEYWGKTSFLKAGIIYADIVNTVSETYAKEIQTTDEFGCGLQGVLRDRSETVFGVLNGVDYEQWSPETDKQIAAKYSIGTITDKYRNKKKLLSVSGLGSERMSKPLIGVISRLADQKGFDLIAKIAAQLFELDFTFILLGTGDKKYHRLFSRLEKKYPDRVKAHLAFDNKLAHLIEAGADIFLMPSHYEPCGLNQMYSMKYGTVPVARKTGGLADTIIDLDDDRRRSTGFLFEDYTGEALLEVVKRALVFFQNKRSWNALMKRSMKRNFSWTKSAKAYAKLYHMTFQLRS